tara:strand:- start:600 stop:1094 length:495 start_codon:yes stop_codon:yes gene_type:complete
MSDLKELSEEQKEELLDKVNQDLANDSGEEEGNTSVFTMNDIDEKAGEGSAQAQYEKSITANAQSLYTLDKILNSKMGAKISRKNLVKLIFATLKLPESGATLKFGGTKDQQQMCEFAYAQMQLACNTRAFVLGVDAMRQARKERKAMEADNESKEVDKGKDAE